MKRLSIIAKLNFQSIIISKDGKIKSDNHKGLSLYSILEYFLYSLFASISNSSIFIALSEIIEPGPNIAAAPAL